MKHTHINKLSKPLAGFVILSLTLFQLSAGFLFTIKTAKAADTLFYSSMEESTFSDWSSRGTDWSQTAGNPGEKKCDNKAAKIAANTIDGKNVITKAVDTTNYSTIILKFWYRIRESDYAFGSGDSVKIQWSINGTDWIDLHTLTNSDGTNQTNINTISWTEKILTFPSDVNNQANFQFRFVGNLYKTGGDKDELWIDCVNLTGEVSSPVCTDADQDTYFAEGGQCGQIDCNDSDANINPGATEICDASQIDEDCDGQSNEDCQCINGATQSCGQTDEGECALGLQTCFGGIWGSCVGNIDPVQEICENSLDDDCDALVDEDCPYCGDGNLDQGEVCEANDTQPCTTGDGYSGIQGCLGDCSGWGECVSQEYCGDGTINDSEECDGQDGVPDEHHICTDQCILEYVPYCGDGEINQQSEICELPDTLNNTYCGQPTTQCDGNKTQTRDEYGNCDASCNPVYDIWSDAICVKDSCGASCAVDADCNDQNENTTDTCNTNTCQCSNLINPFCGDQSCNGGENCETCSQDCGQCQENTGSITIYKYNDLNENGEWNEGESFLSGWEVFISGSMFQYEGPDPITDSEGKFVFSNLPLDDYMVCEVMQDGWGNTEPGDAPFDWGGGTMVVCYNEKVLTSEDKDIDVYFGNKGISQELTCNEQSQNWTEIDKVDIGNLISEFYHIITGWSAANISGNYGGCQQGVICNYRQLLGEDSQVKCTEDDRDAIVVLHAGTNTISKLFVRHLDGISLMDSFEVYANNVKIGEWNDVTQTQTEEWETTEFDVSAQNLVGDVTVKLHAKDGIWASCSTYGQVSIDWVSFSGCGTPYESECTIDEIQECSTGQLGICSAGTQTCSQGGVWGTCQQTNQPTTETCGNGIDEDCDGRDLECGGSVASVGGGGGGGGSGRGLEPVPAPGAVAGASTENQGEVLGEATELPKTGGPRVDLVWCFALLGLIIAGSLLKKEILELRKI